MKILKRKTLAALLCLSLLVGLLPVGAVPALAEVPEGMTIYVGDETISSAGYWTTDSEGKVTSAGTNPPTTGGYIHYDGNGTLTLHNATIKESVSSGTSTYVMGAGIGVFNQNDASKLTIKLEGSNAIENVSTGICVLAFSYSTGDASLTITGSGSLKASGSSSGILVQSNSGDATLTIQNADVTAENSIYSGDGVTVQAGSSSSASLSVNGGSLTATGKSEEGAGIRYTFGSGISGSGKPSLTVSNSAIVKASGDTGGITSNSSPVTPSGAGIVFNNGTGTVYGDVTLQEDLTIGEGESLTLDSGASLDAGDYDVIVDGGTLGAGLEEALGDNVKYPPTITTTTLTDGRVGEPYSTSLGADGTAPITWSVSGSLPAGLILKNDGTITGIPTAQGESTFTVKATNDYGSDSKQFTLTIEAATDVSVESVSLNMITLELTEGSTETLTATITPNNATNQNVAWSSSDSSIVTVEADQIDNTKATVKALKEGSATITATTADGNKTATCTVTVTAKTYSLSVDPSTLNFGSITEGEARPAAQEVTITNTGNQTVTLVQPTAENFEIGKLSETTLAPNTTATFTIQPKDNLSRGSYSEQITITGDNNVSATLTATFTVKEPPYTGKYSYELTTSVGDHGSLTVDRYATEGEKVTITVTPDEAYKLDDLSVTAGGKEVALTAGGDGTYTFTMPSADVRISATFAEDPDWTEPEEPATDVSDIFLDVAPNAWYKDAVQYAYDNGLMTGVSDTEFAPEATTTRAMIVSMLARLEGVESANNAGFADVSNEWYATAVNWAASVGVVNGYEDGTFKPNTAITREQLAAILMNYAQYKGQDVSARADLNGYTDQPSTWAEEAISWSVAEGLLTGVTADTLQPQGAATRAQVAAILQRFLSE